MRNRCHDPKATNYQQYGGKGVTVCEEWRNDCVTFYDWALANGYRDDLTIDRKENHLGYTPENCRWVTNVQNQNNRTDNRRIEYNGENLTIAEWSRKTRLYRNLISTRHDRGWPAEKIFSTEKFGTGKRHSYRKRKSSRE